MGGVTANNPPTIDRQSGGLCVIDFGLCKVHNGQAWYVHDVIELDTDESMDYLLVTPSVSPFIHWGYAIDFTGIFIGELYEGTDKTGGTPMACINRDRNSLAATPMAVSKGALTGTSDGTRIGFVQIGVASGAANKIATAYDGTDKRILKAGTSYIVRVTSKSTGNVISLRMNWLAHTNR